MIETLTSISNLITQLNEGNFKLLWHNKSAAKFKSTNNKLKVEFVFAQGYSSRLVVIDRVILFASWFKHISIDRTFIHEYDLDALEQLVSQIILTEQDKETAKFLSVV